MSKKIRIGLVGLGFGIPGVVAEIAIHFFETAVLPREGFDVFGEKLTFKWPEFPGEKPGVFRMVNPKGYFSDEVVPERVDVPGYEAFAADKKNIQ